MDDLRAWAEGFVAAATADRFAGLLDDHGYTEEDFETEEEASRFGAEQAGRFVELVGTVLAYRQMDRPDEPPQWAERFLSLQRYGGLGGDVGGRYSLRFVGPLLTTSLHVDSLDDVDLEDLWHSFGYDRLEVMPLRPSDMTSEHTARLFDSIVEDLCHDSDLAVEREGTGPYEVAVWIREL